MYSGTFVATNPPTRSGTFINVQTIPLPRSRAGASGIVGLVVSADWGPINQIVEIASVSEALDTYGSGGTANFAITSALLGEGTVGRAGASSVKAYRIAGSAAAKAAVTLQNTTPVNALTLTAKYQGTRGNSLKVTTQVNPIDASKRDLLLYEGTILRESYTYTAAGATTLAILAADINSRSNFVTAAVVVDALPLANVSNSALAAGNSGISTVSGDHTTAQAAFEADGDFSMFALDDWDLYGSTIQGLYRDWNVRLVEEGKLFQTVIGGAAAESTSTATTRTVTVDTPDSGHTAGEGDVFVNITRDLIIGGVTYSSSKMAPRIAGIIAASDSSRSATGSQISDATLSNPPNASQTELAVKGGVIPFVNDGGIVKLQRAVTAYGHAVVPTTAKAKQFQSVTFVRKLWATFRRMDETVTSKLIGRNIVNDEDGREAITGIFIQMLKDLARDDIIIPGASISFDEPLDTETLNLIFSYTPAPNVEQVLAIVNIPVS